MNVNTDLEIIAELHPQHGGDRGQIREMIRLAKRGGADVAKFQLYDSVALLGSDQWRYLEFNEDDTRELKRWCDQEGIELMASVFDRERLHWLEELDVARHKIASRTVAEDSDLCRSILETGKETFVSLGQWTGEAMPFPASARIRYLYCKSKYPAFPQDMSDWPDSFSSRGMTGFSDHTLGIETRLLAIAHGASVVEKHFTLSKMGGRPTERAHICSMTPGELALLRGLGGQMFRTRATMLDIRDRP